MSKGFVESVGSNYEARPILTSKASLKRPRARFDNFRHARESKLVQSRLCLHHSVSDPGRQTFYVKHHGLLDNRCQIEQFPKTVKVKVTKHIFGEISTQISLLARLHATLLSSIRRHFLDPRPRGARTCSVVSGSGAIRP